LHSASEHPRWTCGPSNCEGYACALDLTESSSVNPIASKLNKTTGQFTDTRRLQSKTGMANSVRSSTTLAANEWTNLVKDTDFTGTTSVTGDVEIVTISLIPVPSAAKLFIQVKAENP
jgi:hypothetical protein